MSVVVETTLGDITVDLFLKERPRACLNFLKLCKMKYYNFNLFHTISRGFIAQTGDPTGSRTGGESIYGVLEGPLKRYFESEKTPRIKHTHQGLISFVGNEDGMIGSQFFITLSTDLTYLDEKHCVFGEVMEGIDVLDLLNDTICDGDNRPYKDVRITHTVILDDPYPDFKYMRIPSRSPSPNPERLQGGRIGADEDIDDTEGKSAREISEMLAEREAKARATILEMVGDIPDAEMAPPENVLFVCKLNPVTTDDDLEIIFSRFGKINSCEVIRDRKTGDSLQYAFVEFDDRKSCEDAYFKMDNVLIDDRRIHVDFSQSVSKIKWHGKGRGVTTYDDSGKKAKDYKNDIGKGKYKLSEPKRGGRNHERSNFHKEKNSEYNRRENKRNENYKELDDYRYKDRKRSTEQHQKRSKSRDRYREKSSSDNSYKYREKSKESNVNKRYDKDLDRNDKRKLYDSTYKEYDRSYKNKRGHKEDNKYASSSEEDTKRKYSKTKNTNEEGQKSSKRKKEKRSRSTSSESSDSEDDKYNKKRKSQPCKSHIQSKDDSRRKNKLKKRKNRSSSSEN